MSYLKNSDSGLNADLIDLLPIGTCLIDENWVVYAWNNRLAAWTQHLAADICGQPLTDIYPSLQKPRMTKRIAQVFKTGAPMVFSAAIHKHFIPIGPEDQPEKWMIQDAQVQRISLDPPRALITIVDKTAECRQLCELRTERARLREANEKAESATRAKTAFLANMSHEIRTPMTAILGYTQLLQHPDLDPQDRDSHIDTIHRNGEHLLALINNILDLSKIEAEAVELEHIPFAVNDVVNDVLRSMYPRAHAKGIGLARRSQTPLPVQISGDPTRLRQILVNLVGNAIKFTAQGQVCIEVGVEQPEVEKLRVEQPGVENIETQAASSNRPRLTFAVQDTGIGIPSNKIEKLFDKFSQCNSSTTRQFGGTGLGLAISKQLTEMLGGQIKVTSEPGQGSTFAFQIAIEARDLNQCATADDNYQTTQNLSQPEQVGKPQNSLNGLKILVAEDSADNQRLISHHLTRAAADWTLVDNGQKVLDRVLGENESYDLILMDMQMPVMDGYQATQKLRQAKSLIPVLALTAHAMSHDQAACEKFGCDGYLTKPFKPKELIQTILDLVDDEPNGSKNINRAA